LKRKYVIAALSVWLFIASAVAQEQRFINFSVKDGMPEKYLYSAAQDAAGYMWFGTGSGLYRYDGHHFKAFRSPADKPGRSIGNILQTITADSLGNLWLGSLNALQWYNPRSNLFWAPDYSKPDVKTLCDSYITQFTKQGSSGMLISTNKNYFFSFNTADSSIRHWAALYPPTASKNPLRLIITGNTIWAVHSEGIYRFSTSHQYTGFYAYSRADITYAVYDAVAGSIVMGTWGSGLLRFDTEKKQFSNNAPANDILKKETLFCLTQQAGGAVWAGGYHLISLNKKDGFAAAYKYKKESEFDLGVSKISQLFFDREKNLWICSFNGLAMMPWQNNQVKTVQLIDKISGNSVEPSAVTGIPGTNELLIANTTTTGLMHYNTVTNKVSTIVNPLEKKVERARIISLVFTPDSTIYAGDDTHFFRYQSSTRQLIPFELKDTEGKAITGIGRNVFNSKGQVFISSVNNGFYIWDIKDRKLTHFNKLDIDKTSDAAGDNVCNPTLVDKAGNTWFTSSSGVYEYRVAEERYYHHAYKPVSKDVPVPEANCIAEDKAGHYWITTINNGLYELYFEKGTEVLKNYTQNSGIGLGTDYLYKIKADPFDSTLWISTLTGLVKFDPFQKQVLSCFVRQQGFTENDAGYTFNITPDGKLVQLFFANFNIIDLRQYQFNNKPPVLVFNSVKVLDREYVYDLKEPGPELVLTHSENFLQFEFAALSFNNSNYNRYAYMLEGADKDWVYSGNRNTVTYAGLKPGTYTFKVKAASNDGVWSSEKIIHIAIQSPFYATWWFILLVSLVLAALVYWWSRYRIAAVKKEEKLKSDFRQQIAETEMKALRAQMNPHFIFNCLNSIQKYILQQDHFAASQYLTRFSRLIRLILDHSNQDVIQLAGEIEMLKLYVEMEQLRFENRFDFAVQVADDIDPQLAAIPSMLIQPYLENAIWHGLLHKDEKGLLLLRFSRSGENTLQVMIEDDGVGRAMAAKLKSKQVLKKKSYGMQITEDRIAIINRTQYSNATSAVTDLFDAGGRASGTMVVLQIPLQLLTKTTTDDQGRID
jgi:ligand-binding sensor domain-containing protein